MNKELREREGSMMQTPTRRITVTSSVKEISTDQLENRMGVRGVTPFTPVPPTAGFWTDIQRRRELFFLHLGYFLHG
jgi:hypothetical protein